MTVSASPEIKQLLGNFLVAGLATPRLNDRDKQFLEEYRPTGIILFARNFVTNKPYTSWIETLNQLWNDIVKYSGREKFIISIDHEGGHVLRPPAPITRFPYAAVYGPHSEDVATAMATEVKSLGFNISWSPACDVFSNPNNPVPGPRCFSSSPHEVAKLATIYLRALQKNGLLGCTKHFPGHGDTSVDSHLEMPRVDKTFDDLMQLELIPFKAMIDEGVQFVMSSHILFPNIDPNRPATFSRIFLRDILRKQLGFKGIVVSDDLHMRAIWNMMGAEDIAIEAFGAGLQLLCMARHPEDQDRTIIMAHSLERGLKERRIDEEDLQASKAQIDKLVNQLPMYQPTVLPVETLRKHAELAISVTGS